MVLSSPLERARETAEPIARLQGLAVEILPELVEIDFGELKGKSLKRLKSGRLWKVVQGNPGKFRFPGGESFREAQERVTVALNSLAEKFNESDVVVCVSQSDLIRLAIARIMGLPMDHFQHFRINTASVSVLFLQEGKASFGSINHVLDFQLPFK